MTTVKSALLFLAAAVAEIGGAYLVWVAVRDGRGIWIGMLGVLSLGLYGLVATLQSDDEFGPGAGRLRWSVHRGVARLGHGVRRLLAGSLRPGGSLDLPRGRRDHHVRATLTGPGSGTSHRTASGGSEISAENGCPFHGMGSAAMVPQLPAFVPP